MRNEIETTGDLIEALKKCDSKDKIRLRNTDFLNVVTEPGSHKTYIEVGKIKYVGQSSYN